MVYLILAVMSSVLVSVTMRASEKHVSNSISMLAANYLMCTGIACMYAGMRDPFPQAEGLAFSVMLSIVSGMFYLGSFMLLQWNTAVNGVVLSSMFMRLGVMVPTLVSMVFFREVPHGAQIAGMLAAVAAVLLINLERGSKKPVSSTGLVLLLVIGGGTDAMVKIFEELGNPPLKNHFLMYTFFVAFVLCVILCVLKKQGLTLPDLGFGLVIGVPNYFSARFLMLSLSSVPAIVAYPTYSVATIVCVALIGRIVFQESLHRRQKLAMLIILAALVLLNT